MASMTPVRWSGFRHGSLAGYSTCFPNRSKQAINPDTDDLGRYSGTFAYSEAHGINSFSQVVGFFETDTVRGHAFRTAPNRPINPITDDLGTLTPARNGGSIAYAINDFGQVAGASVGG